MQLSVRLGEKSFIVTLPERWVQSDTFVAQVDGETFTARFEASTSTLFLLEPTTGAGHECLERPVRLRSRQIRRFAAEGETSIAGEFSFGPHVQAFETSVTRYAPGQEHRAKSEGGKGQTLRSQITGKVLKILITTNAVVKEGTPLLIIEAMKMENRVFAPKDGKIDAIKVKEGAMVSVGDELLRLAAVES